MKFETNPVHHLASVHMLARWGQHNKLHSDIVPYNLKKLKWWAARLLYMVDSTEASQLEWPRFNRRPGSPEFILSPCLCLVFISKSCLRKTCYSAKSIGVYKWPLGVSLSKLFVHLPWVWLVTRDVPITFFCPRVQVRVISFSVSVPITVFPTDTDKW